MSRTCNNFYFDTIEEIENSGEDYNRNYSVKALQEVGFSEKEANDFCDDLESKWDIQVDYLAEVEREESPFDD
jgi:Holliday junction resolvasome RuvABC DNA-binding subunit